MYLIVGLGNPGEQYRWTRHNLGFRVIDELIRRLGMGLRVGKGDYLAGKASYQGVELLLVKPLSFMNLSGRVVSELVTQYRLMLAELLVICDDVNLPLGKIRLRRQGSDGGHHGLASIIYYLGSSDFPRLRIGVGNPPPNVHLTQYVLEEFSPEEQSIVEQAVQTAADAALSFASDGIEKAMNLYNR